MNDLRIKQYRQTLIDLQSGREIGHLNCEPDDTMSGLGREILNLKNSLQESPILMRLIEKVNTGLSPEDVLD